MRKKPIAQLKAEGNFRSDRHEITVTNKPLSAIPEPFVKKTRKEIFNYYAGTLLKRKLLFEEDIAMIETLSDAIYTRNEMIDVLKDEGYFLNHVNTKNHNNKTEHPAIKILKSANETIIKYGSKLGFNLLDKDRIKVHVEPEDEESPLMKALR